jgi:pimeloyl-ACP methyl ester carboxylesterase
MRRIGVNGDVPSRELAAYVELLKRGDGGRAFLRIMRSFERTTEFERRILGHLARRPYPAAVAWGEDDPALPLATQGEEVRVALGLDALHRLPGRHFVPEDAPAEIARLVAELAQADAA